MCNACIITVGGFLGAVALAKAGGFGHAKTAIVAFAMSYLARRK